mmetsp:Transcript_28635/g.27627  ORF Transcript_28635/g.27627 Transcript_28635/m.27627 type:complete len:246 (-) Transcript_28635:37-774(-)
MVWAETPTNPTLKIFDIKAVAKICKENNILFVVDNTFFTPYLQNPLDMGADMVIHSLTKYIGGHSDLVMGCICLNDKALYDKLFFIVKSIGSGASPFDCYLALRGSKTLALRMERAQTSAMELATYLEKHPKVDRVVYPGLKSHPNYELNKKQSRGSGGMITFFIKGELKNAEKFLRAVKIFTLAESLGGVESLIEHPALMTHASVSAENRKTLGILDTLIRISVGVEDVKDLRDDLDQAFKASV